MMLTNPKKIKPNTLVLLDVPERWKEYKASYMSSLGITDEKELILCLGEVTNQPGHYIMVSPADGTIAFGLPAELFRLPTQEEL